MSVWISMGCLVCKGQKWNGAGPSGKTWEGDEARKYLLSLLPGRIVGVRISSLQNLIQLKRHRKENRTETTVIWSKTTSCHHLQTSGQAESTPVFHSQDMTVHEPVIGERRSPFQVPLFFRGDTCTEPKMYFCILREKLSVDSTRRLYTRDHWCPDAHVRRNLSERETSDVNEFPKSPPIAMWRHVSPPATRTILSCSHVRIGTHSWMILQIGSNEQKTKANANVSPAKVCSISKENGVILRHKTTKT